MAQQSKIELAKQLIISEFSFLEKQGFQLSFKRLKDETFIEYMEIEYCNSEKKRKVSIGYSKGKVYKDIKYTFDVSVTRLPYLNVKDIFTLWIYLKSINKDFSTSMVNHFDAKEAEVILKKIASAVKEYMSEIISGNEWFDNYWPRW